MWAYVRTRAVEIENVIKGSTKLELSSSDHAIHSMARLYIHTYSPVEPLEHDEEAPLSFLRHSRDDDECENETAAMMASWKVGTIIDCLGEDRQGSSVRTCRSSEPLD
eukprot:GHVU01143795.1.p2 GENE.GHVU01143795.1~~GHVU01143795.1.p2  ORF type:complete len:108 (-),score=6.73 GHVU01143795.1:683-1006(-)